MAESHKDRCWESIGILVLIFLKKRAVQIGGCASVLCVLHTKTHTNFKPASTVPLLSLLLFSILPHFAFRFCNAHSSQRSLVSCAIMLFHFIVARFVVLCRFSYRVWSCTAVWDLVPLGISYSALILDTQCAHEGMKTPSSNKRQQLKGL